MVASPLTCSGAYAYADQAATPPQSCPTTYAAEKPRLRMTAEMSVPVTDCR